MLPLCATKVRVFCVSDVWHKALTAVLPLETGELTPERITMTGCLAELDRDRDQRIKEDKIKWEQYTQEAVERVYAMAMDTKILLWQRFLGKDEKDLPYSLDECDLAGVCEDSTGVSQLEVWEAAIAANWERVEAEIKQRAKLILAGLDHEAGDQLGEDVDALLAALKERKSNIEKAIKARAQEEKREAKKRKNEEKKAVKEKEKREKAEKAESNKCKLCGKKYVELPCRKNQWDECELFGKICSYTQCFECKRTEKGKEEMKSHEEDCKKRATGKRCKKKRRG